ncbi:hypothetical protein PLUA15_240368 [Pseudomonas lundensis]|uniref:Uncharacterized protein n=1 Tax=Pseudomonas lundensis TaxID=86185 RepID=A0AAX2H9I9_9PSED|nr:hypothetical protein PLUA15_240368 [Pseudomonas lundensis]
MQNKIGNFLIQLQTSSVGSIVYVVRLSAYPHELANPANAQAQTNGCVWGPILSTVLT